MRIEIVASAKAQAAIDKACEKEPLPLAFVNAANDKPAEILVYGEIGDPFEQSDAKSIGQFLRANKGKPVHVRINSPGGLFFDGLTVHNALKSHDGQVTTTIEGNAASAATIISLAGKPSRIFENASYMIHRVQVGGFGNGPVMRELADIADKLDEGLALTYQSKTSLSKAKLMAMMTGAVDGTWLTAKEAKAHGFVDEIVPLSSAKPLNTATKMQARREDARSSLLMGEK